MNDYVVNIYYDGEKIDTVWVSTTDKETAIDSACVCCAEEIDKYGICEEFDPYKLTAEILEN